MKLYLEATVIWTGSKKKGFVIMRSSCELRNSNPEGGASDEIFPNYPYLSLCILNSPTYA